MEPVLTQPNGLRSVLMVRLIHYFLRSNGGDHQSNLAQNELKSDCQRLQLEPPSVDPYEAEPVGKDFC